MMSFCDCSCHSLIRHEEYQSLQSVMNNDLLAVNEVEQEQRDGQNGEVQERDGTVDRPVMSLCEAKRRQIGISILSMHNMTLEIFQFQDLPNYPDVLSLITLYSPKQIILPDISANGHLYKQVQKSFPDCEIDTMSRKYFDLSIGATLLARISTENVLEELPNVPVGGTSCAALLQGFQGQMGISKLSVRINKNTSSVQMDANTVERLDLFSVNRGSHSKSLFGVLNKTLTQGGARLLRENVSQPPCKIETIQYRQAIVKEIYSNDNLFHGLPDLLKHMHNMEEIVSSVLRPKSSLSWAEAKSQVSKIIQLHSCIRQVENLNLFLSNEPQFRTVLGAEGTLWSDENSLIADMIDNVFHKELITSKGLTQEKIISMVRPGLSARLDLTRRTFSEVTSDLQSYVNKVAEQNQIAGARLKHHGSINGWVLLIPSKYKTSVPKYFMKVKDAPNGILVTSSEMKSMSRKLNDSRNEALFCIHQVITDEIIGSIAQSTQSLMKSSYMISFIDMMYSLAAYAKRLGSVIVMPELTSSGPLTIQKASNPLLDALSSHEYIPNDFISTPMEGFTVLTGPNMSGKTTYMKQLCHLTIVAQLGSYIPAISASMRVTDRIFARLGCSDVTNNNVSSFMQEMQEMNYIINRCTTNSLVVIDELGRSTSSVSAVPICFSICEYFIGLTAFTYFATHFIEMSQDLNSLYPCIRTWHFNVEVVNEDVINELRFHYTLERGILDSDLSYGIETARACGIPGDTVDLAYKFKAIIMEKESQRVQTRKKSTMSLEYISDRLKLLSKSNLSEEGKKAYIKDLLLRYAEAKELDDTDTMDIS